MTRTRQRGPMRVLHIIGLVAFALASTKLCASAKQSSGAMVWFERANDRVNLRMAGAAPFHLSVRFHAYPGLEFIKGKPTILSGDGIYEETWLSLHEWEREINFAGYHALEIQSGGVRKMEATSDYEPARVAMLLDAILNPISRYALSSVLQEGREHWKIESGSKDDHPYVKISSMRSISPAITLGTAYLLMPDGVLLAWNENGLITTWQDLTEFSGRAVARHISIQADTRELVSADISVSATNERGVGARQIAGDAATPGLTLRPYHPIDVSPLESLTDSRGGVIPRISLPEITFHAYIDRRGYIRDVELISAAVVDRADAADGIGIALQDIREWRYRPGRVDGDPCQVVWSNAFIHR
jgi:hypothetical protein